MGKGIKGLRDNGVFEILDSGFWIAVANLERRFCVEDFSGEKGREWV